MTSVGLVDEKKSSLTLGLVAKGCRSRVVIYTEILLFVIVSLFSFFGYLSLRAHFCLCLCFGLWTFDNRNFSSITIYCH